MARKLEKKDLLKNVVKHIDIKKYDSTEIIDAMRNMSFTSRDTARAADIYMMMVKEKSCTNILTLAGSTSAAGCMQVYVDMVRNKMIDVVVSTGASVIDMDLFEALGFKHYIGEKENIIPDTKLRELYIDRIYDTFIDEEHRMCLIQGPAAYYVAIVRTFVKTGRSERRETALSPRPF